MLSIWKCLIFYIPLILFVRQAYISYKVFFFLTAPWLFESEAIKEKKKTIKKINTLKTIKKKVQQQNNNSKKDKKSGSRFTHHSSLCPVPQTRKFSLLLEFLRLLKLVHSHAECSINRNCRKIKKNK